MKSETRAAAMEPDVLPLEGGVHDRFPVTLIASDGAFRSSVVSGWGEYFDERELSIQTGTLLPRGRKVRVRFEAPPSLSLVHGGLDCDFPAEVAAARETPRAEDGRYELVVKWDAPLPELVGSAVSRRARKLGALLVAALGMTAWLRWVTFSYFWYDPVLYTYSIAVGVYFFSRFFLSCVHKPPPFTGYEPTLSVVISVRNDREAIARAVASCFAAEYAPGKREVIVVDDGSTDGTGQALVQLKRKFPDLRTYSIPPSGKRFGMAKGIREAKGEIVVVIDSDTTLERTALRHIVCGFEDPTLGAVSGYTGVTNADKNWLTRMQDVRYLVAFELMKAPESVFGAVTCCPGCLSAYRRKYVLEILDPWLKQTFMGVQTTFGDDRSLTNYILRDHRIVYNPLARSSTIVPENWMHYMRQQCRWKKSWLREAPIAARILARKHPAAALAFYVSAVCSLVSPLMVVRVLWWDFMDQQALMLGYVGGLVGLSLLMSLFALWRRPTRYWYMTLYWVATQVLIMGPQTYYALLTVRKNHWGTR